MGTTYSDIHNMHNFFNDFQGHITMKPKNGGEFIRDKKAFLRILQLWLFPLHKYTRFHVTANYAAQLIPVHDWQKFEAKGRLKDKSSGADRIL